MGGAVAYALAARHPERVARLAVLDMLLPGFGLEAMADLSQPGRGFWHFAFHRAEGIAETLVEGRERAYLDHFFTEQAHRRDAIDEAARTRYAAAYAGRAKLRAGFALYRAMFQDAEDNRALAAHPLTMPVLAIGGEHGARDWVEGSLRAVARDVTGLVAPDSGHWLAEEVPDWLTARLLAFADGEADDVPGLASAA